jgi:hypothetical protein
MGPDFRADAVLERGDDLAARRVVLRVCGEHEQHVELQTNRVALDLDVALLKDVEEADLDLAGKIRELVDREDAAIGPRQQAVVHGQLVGEIQAGLRGPDRIDVPDHVGDRHVRRGELLDVARFSWQPRDREAVALGREPRAAGAAHRGERVVVDLAAGDDRNVLVEQAGDPAQDPALGLSPQSEQNEIVPREDGVDNLRDHRVVVPDDARKHGLPGAELPDQVASDLVLDGG